MGGLVKNQGPGVSGGGGLFPSRGPSLSLFSQICEDMENYEEKI